MTLGGNNFQCDRDYHGVHTVSRSIHTDVSDNLLTSDCTRHWLGCMWCLFGDLPPPDVVFSRCRDNFTFTDVPCCNTNACVLTSSTAPCVAHNPSSCRWQLLKLKSDIDSSHEIFATPARHTGVWVVRDMYKFLCHVQRRGGEMGGGDWSEWKKWIVMKQIELILCK